MRPLLLATLVLVVGCGERDSIRVTELTPPSSAQRAQSTVGYASGPWQYVRLKPGIPLQAEVDLSVFGSHHPSLQGSDAESQFGPPRGFQSGLGLLRGYQTSRGHVVYWVTISRSGFMPDVAMRSLVAFPPLPLPLEAVLSPSLLGLPLGASPESHLIVHDDSFGVRIYFAGCSITRLEWFELPKGSA